MMLTFVAELAEEKVLVIKVNGVSKYRCRRRIGTVPKIWQLAKPAMQLNDTGLVENAQSTTDACSPNPASEFNILYSGKSGSVA